MDIFNLFNSNLAAPETPRSTFTFMASDDLTGEHAESEDGDEGQNEAESKMDDELLFAGCLCDSDVSNGADHTEQECGLFDAPNGLNADQDQIGDIIPKESETFLADEDAEINADGNTPGAHGDELPRVDGEFPEQPDESEEKAHSIAEPEEQQQDEDKDDASSKEGKEDGVIFAEQPLDEEPSFQEEEQQDEDKDDASSKEGKEDDGMVPAEQTLTGEPTIPEEKQQDEDKDDASSKEGKEDGGMVPAEQTLTGEPSILEEQEQDEDQDDASSKEGKEDAGIIPAEDEEPSILEGQQQDEDEDDASSKEGKEDGGMIPAEQPLDEEPSTPMPLQADVSKNPTDLHALVVDEALADSTLLATADGNADALSTGGHQESGHMSDEQLGWVGLNEDGILEDETAVADDVQSPGTAHSEMDADGNSAATDSDELPGVDGEFAEQPDESEEQTHSIAEPEEQQDEDEDDGSSKEGKEDGVILAEQPLDEEPSILEEQQQDDDEDDASRREEEDGVIFAEQPLDEEPSILEEQQQDEDQDDGSSREGKEDAGIIPAEHPLDEEPSIQEEQQQDEDQDDASSKEGKEDGVICAEQPLDEEPSIQEEQQKDEDEDDASSKEDKEDAGIIPAEQPFDEMPSSPEEQQQDEDQDDASSKEDKEDAGIIPAEQPLDAVPSIPMLLEADVSKNPTDLHALVVDEALADSTLLAAADDNADAFSTGGHQESGHMSDEQLGWVGLNEDGILEDETAVADDVQSPGKAHSEMDADGNSAATDSDELPGVDGEFAEQPDESEEQTHSIAEPEEQQDEDEDDASSKEGKEDGDMIPSEQTEDVAEFQAETDRHDSNDGIDEFEEDTGQMGAVGCLQLFQKF